ncbi:MAG: hypothetical protein COA94_03250 [Rickettsiales bacterium]|nr:MAG: hypothetical protein COA94_03250 [Rickettsiales bacterium]
MHKQELATTRESLQLLLAKEDIDMCVNRVHSSSSTAEYKYCSADLITSKLLETEAPALEEWESLSVLPAFNSKDSFVRSMIHTHIAKYCTFLVGILYELQSSKNLAILSVKFKQELAEANFHKANPGSQSE